MYYLNMKKYLNVSIFVMLTTLSFAQQNIMIDNNGSPNEPSIAMNPNNTNQLVAGSNINNVYRSNDGGLTWTKSTITSPYGVWGDPVIIADNNNDFYFAHLSNPSAGSFLDRIVCQKSTDAGATWSSGSYTGLNSPKDQDKQWLTFDPNTNTIYMSWTQFDAYGSSNPANKSVILFSKSTDFGVSWSSPIKLNNVDGSCIDDSTTVEGAVPTFGPSGQVYVAWSGPNGLVFKKSTDQGVTWSANETQIIPTHEWDLTIPGIDRCNGMPITACDLSPSTYSGTIYVNWADQSNGTNDTDIFISKSTDGGTTWSSPLRVNDDAPGKHQFLTWMSIDQTTGYIYIVFYDRRNYTNNNTDVYLAYSTDGGSSFTNTKISTTPFSPTSSVFFGDYNNIVAHNGVIRPIWTRLVSGQLSVWTAIISQNQLETKEFEANNDSNSVTNYPNPVQEDCYFAFKLYKESPVSITIYDLNGKEVYKVIENKTYPMGKHLISIKSNLLKKGEYIYEVQSNYYKKSKKLIVE
jgi:hypothetical protein